MNNKVFTKSASLILALVLSVTGSALLLTSCSKTAATESEETTTAATTTLPTPTPVPETTAVTTASPYAVNPFTGIQDMDPANVGKRSVTVSINNHLEALPSRGLSFADAVYEFETEGGQTRLLALYADIAKIPEVGSLRSARIIACDLSGGTDSIFVHYGENARVPYFLDENGIDDIDGNIYSAGVMKSENGQITLGAGKYFWRDATWRSQRALEHTAVTNGTQILRAISDLKIPIEGETPSLFNFTATPSVALASGSACNQIVIFFSNNNDDSTFTYNPDIKMYTKSEYGDPQIDESTGGQITVKNVFVLYANIKPHGDTTIDAYLTEGGTGYYISEGKMIEINWTKDSHTSPIKVFTKDGSPVDVNAGKSYINVVRKTYAAKTKIS